MCKWQGGKETDAALAADFLDKLCAMPEAKNQVLRLAAVL